MEIFVAQPYTVPASRQRAMWKRKLSESTTAAVSVTMVTDCPPVSGANDEAAATTAAAVGRSNRNGSYNCRRLIVHETKLIHRRLRTSPTYRRVTVLVLGAVLSGI